MFVNFLVHFHFILFEIIFLIKFFSLSSKSVFFTKLAISFLLAKFACANLDAKYSAVNLFRSSHLEVFYRKNVVRNFAKVTEKHLCLSLFLIKLQTIGVEFFYFLNNENIVVFPYRSRFPVNLICCIAFGSASSSCCLLKSAAIIL